MVKLPKDISPGAAARRSLLVDSAVAAILGVSALVFCAGLGIVGVIALSTLLLLAPWYGAEACLRLVRRRRDKST
jgi:hypothetical protein